MSGRKYTHKGEAYGFQFNALSMDFFAPSFGCILYKPRAVSKWNPDIFQSAFLCMGRTNVYFSYAVLCCGKFFQWNSD